MTSNFKLPKGTYYIGDPCYILDKVTYDWFLDYTGFFQDVSKMITYNHPFVILPTYHGDGACSDLERRDYAVDSGTLGCIPESLVISDEIFERKLNRGDFYKIKFDEDFYCGEFQGVLKFGHIVIDTDPEVEDEISWEDYDSESWEQDED